MADDNTTITKLDRGSLIALKTTSVDFGTISGLKCNFEKSCVMLTHDYNITNYDIELIQQLGFKFVDEVTLLGLKINSKCDVQKNAFEVIATKINNLIDFWSKFHLTLPGRIAICNTLMIPQINYLGCFLQPDKDTLLKIQNRLDAYCVGNLKVAQSKLYCKVNEGGLGLFDLTIFLEAQKCSWIKRSVHYRIDNWRYDICSLSPTGNPVDIRLTDVSAQQNPIIYNIVSAYEKLLAGHTTLHSNYLLAPIYDNESILDPQEGRKINVEFFGRDFYNHHKVKIRELTLLDCLVQNNFKSIEAFATSGLPVNHNLWWRLRAVYSMAKKNYSTSYNTVGSSETISTLFMRCKKGSKKFRHTLEADRRATGFMNINTVKTFFELTQTSNILEKIVTRGAGTGTTNGVAPIPVHALRSAKRDPQVNPSEFEDGIKKSFFNWNTTGFRNDLKEFLYQMRNNQLGLNARVSHFNDKCTDKCTFCRILNKQTTNRETFIHLFLTCPITSRILGQFLTDYFIDTPEANSKNQDFCFFLLVWYN